MIAQALSFPVVVGALDRERTFSVMQDVVFYPRAQRISIVGLCLFVLFQPAILYSVGLPLLTHVNGMEVSIH